MNLGFYLLDLSVALIAIGVFLHISKCDREHVTRAELDKNLAEMRVELERLGASRRDVVPSAADVNHVDAGLSPVPDLHDGNKLYDLAVEWMDELKPNNNNRNNDEGKR